MTFSNDEFMMYKGLYNFQLYSLHELSILIYLGLISISETFLGYSLKLIKPVHIYICKYSKDSKIPIFSILAL